MMRNARRVRLVIGLVALYAGIVGVTAAAAGAPAGASGTVGNTAATFNSVRFADGNLIADVTATAAYTGTLTGTSTINGRLIVRADGSATFHDVEVFTGTVNGVAGTLTFSLNGSNDSALNSHATAAIIDSSGGLSGLHGVLHEVGTVVPPTGPVGTYTGQIG
jgi:hypothetical protein